MHKKNSADSFKKYLHHLNDCTIIYRAFAEDVALIVLIALHSVAEYLSKYKTFTGSLTQIPPSFLLSSF